MNAKDPQVVQKFITLRAQGWSFARIAAELDVSKPTLIHWRRQHHPSGSNLSAVKFEPAASPSADLLKLRSRNRFHHHRACLMTVNSPLGRLNLVIGSHHLRSHVGAIKKTPSLGLGLYPQSKIEIQKSKMLRAHSGGGVQMHPNAPAAALDD